MSIEKLPESLIIDAPKITFQHLRDLIASIKDKFKDKLENEAWMQSVNPDAILIKNLDILYEDNQGDDKKDNLCSPEVAQKFLRLIFKRAEGELAQRRKTGLVVIPHAIEYLKTQFGTEIIDKIQSQYRQHQEKLASIPIQNLECIDESLKEKKESEEFTNFIGRAKNVYVSTDEEKIKLFLEVIKDPQFYQHEIFKDSRVLYYALAACRRGEITSIQYAGLSQWIELKKTYGNESVEIYSLFDDKGEFTKKAKKYILKYILNKNIVDSVTGKKVYENPLLTDSTLEQFKEKLKKLPITDQVFIKVKSISKGYTLDMELGYYAAHKTILYGNEIDELSLLSINAYQCLIDTAFPSHPTKLVPRLSNIGLKDVEEGTRKNQRIVSSYFPRPHNIKLITPSSRFFHKTGAKTTTVIGLHDVYHALLMSKINQKALGAIGCALDAIRGYTGIQWTSGSWKFADAPYVGDITDKTDPSESFLNIIGITYQYDSDNFQPEMAAIFLDMVFNPDKWGKDINFDKMKPLREDIDFFKMLRSENIKIPGHENLNIHLECIKTYSSFFNKKDEPKINLLKAAIIYEGMRSKRSHNEIEFLLSFNYLPVDISFKTIKKSTKINDKEELTNFAYIHWHGKPFDIKAYYKLLHSSSSLFNSDNQNYDINKQNDKGETLLHFLAQDPQISIQEFNHLIKSGADIFIKDNRNNTALHYLIFNRKWDEFKYFLKNENIDLEGEFKGNSWMLHEAVKNNDVEFVKYFVEDKKFDINKVDKKGKTALYYALKGPWHIDRIKPNIQLIDYLIRMGAKDNETFESIFNHFLKKTDITIDEKSTLTQNFLNLFDKISLDNQMNLLIGRTYNELDNQLRIQSMIVNIDDLKTLLKKLTTEKIGKLIIDGSWRTKIVSLIQTKDDYLVVSNILPKDFLIQNRDSILKQLNNMELMKYLIEINRKNTSKETDFLRDVVSSKNVTIIKYMFEEIKIDLSIKNINGHTILYYYDYSEMTMQGLITFIEENNIDLSKSISLRNYIPPLIKNTSDLSIILHFLPENERLAFWKEHSNTLALDLSHLDKKILSSEKIHFDIKLELIDQYINSRNFNFWDFLKYLEDISPNTDQYDRIFQIQSLKDQIDFYKFTELLTKLNDEQKNKLIQDRGWMSKVITLMSSIDDFLLIEKHFSGNQEIINTSRDHAVSFIKNTFDLFIMLELYPKSEQWDFWEKNYIKLKLGSYRYNYPILSSEKIDFKIKLVLIDNHIDSNRFNFEHFLNDLKVIKPEEQQTDILIQSKLFLDDKINVYKLVELFKQLSQKQQNKLIQDGGWLNKIPSLIKSIYNFLLIKEYFSEDQQITILLNSKILNDKTKTYSTSYTDKLDDLNKLLIKLTSAQKDQLILNKESKNYIISVLQQYGWGMRPDRFLQILNYPVKKENSTFFRVLCDEYVPQNFNAIIKEIDNETDILNFINLLSAETLKICLPIEIQSNIIDSIAACNSINDPKIKEIALFALLKVYLSELASEKRPQYKPTLFGIPLPAEAIPEFLLGIPKEIKLAAGEAVKDAKLKNTSLDEIYKNPAYSEALSKGDLGNIFNALKSVEKEIIVSGVRSDKRV